MISLLFIAFCHLCCKVRSFTFGEHKILSRALASAKFVPESISAVFFSLKGIHLDWRKKTWGRTQGLTKGTHPLKQGNYSLRRPPKLIIPQIFIEQRWATVYRFICKQICISNKANMTRALMREHWPFTQNWTQWTANIHRELNQLNRLSSG